MSYVSIGSQTKDRPSTQTLRQALKSGRKLPEVSFVKVIFLPGKLPYITLVTEADYKVVLDETSSLFGAVMDSLDSWSKDCSALAIRLVSRDPVEWELSISTNENQDYKKFDWGYSLTLQPRKGKK